MVPMCAWALIRRRECRRLQRAMCLWSRAAATGCGWCPLCRSPSCVPAINPHPTGMTAAFPTSSSAGRTTSFLLQHGRVPTSASWSRITDAPSLMKARLGSLFIVSVIDILGFGILIPLVPYMGVRFNAPPEWITPIMGAYSLCQLVAAPFWGNLSDRYGRRPILMTSLAGACISYLILGFAGNIWWLLISRMLGGFMAGNISAAFAYASDVSEPQNRAASLGLIGAAIGIGFTVGPAIGGLLAGNDLHTASFLLPATVSAGLSVLAIVLVTFMLPESNPPELRSRRRAGPRTGPIRLLLERPALRL